MHRSLILAISALFAVVTADNWAVLVAGSNGYENYRHQADVCHAYHVLRRKGFPDSNIIVMMYDDIAYNEQNPFPGNIINRPGGMNVYRDVPLDYTGSQVNPENFMNVLKGNSEATGGRKVLKSTSQDNVFVYMTDHGAEGLFAFPDSYLYADQLNDTITYMYENQMYDRLMLYMEACESGSMFYGYLSDDINVFALTASTPTESSYACYYSESRKTWTIIY